MSTPSNCQRRNCPATAKKRGYCQRHYEKAWRTGYLPVIARPIDPTLVRTRIAEHLDRGRSLHGLAKAAGVAPTSLRKVYREGTPIRATTAQRVMSVLIPPSHVGIERRIQALARIGYSAAEFCRVSGISEVTIHDGFRRGPLTATLRFRIAAAYERLSATPYDAPRTVRRALKLGYLAPADWEYLDIDDPVAHPASQVEDLSHEQYVHRLIAGEYRNSKATLPPRLARLEAVAILTSQHWTAERISDWLRMDRRTVVRMRAESRGERKAWTVPRSPYCRGEARHFFTVENTRVDKSGKRHCMECERVYKKTHRRIGGRNKRMTVKIAA